MQIRKCIWNEMEVVLRIHTIPKVYLSSNSSLNEKVTFLAYFSLKIWIFCQKRQKVFSFFKMYFLKMYFLSKCILLNFILHISFSQNVFFCHCIFCQNVFSDKMYFLTKCIFCQNVFFVKMYFLSKCIF